MRDANCRGWKVIKICNVCVYRLLTTIFRKIYALEVYRVCNAASFSYVFLDNPSSFMQRDSRCRIARYEGMVTDPIFEYFN